MGTTMSWRGRWTVSGAVLAVLVTISLAGCGASGSTSSTKPTNASSGAAGDSVQSVEQKASQIMGWQVTGCHEDQEIAQLSTPGERAFACDNSEVVLEDPDGTVHPSGSGQ
jgi:hypothetical protein